MRVLDIELWAAADAEEAAAEARRKAEADAAADCNQGRHRSVFYMTLSRWFLSSFGFGVGSGVITLFVGGVVGTGFACTSSGTANVLNKVFWNMDLRSSRTLVCSALQLGSKQL